MTKFINPNPWSKSEWEAYRRSITENIMVSPLRVISASETIDVFAHPVRSLRVISASETIDVFAHRVRRWLLPASVAQLDAPSDWRPGGRGFNPRRGRQHSFVEIDHEIFSTVILSLPLIQEGQLSVSGEKMCTILNRLEV